MSEMRVAMHREIPADEEFRRQWNELAERMEQPEVFYTWEWAAAVAHAYGEVLRPLLFAGYEGEKLVGIAALAEDAKGEACFLASTTADYCDFISAPSDRKKLIELVMEELLGMGTADLKLANLPADSASAALLRVVARKSGYGMFARPAYSCAQIPLNSAEEREQVARSARRSSNKARNAFARIGKVTVDHRKRFEEFEAEFPEFVRAHVARFLVTGRISHLVREERCAFMEELAKLLAARGWLALSTLKVDGRTIAWHFGFQFGGTWFSYLPTFDSEIRNLHPGPGAYLLYQILQEAAQDRETNLVDLGLGDEGYKKQYAKTGRHTLYVTASRSKLRLIRHICRYQAASWLKRSPRFEKAARGLVATAAALRAEGMFGWFRKSGLGMVRTFSGEAEFSFLEWVEAGAAAADSLSVQPTTAKLLAIAAIRYKGEGDALQYVLRSAERLQAGEVEGFSLVANGGTPVHFCWLARFEGFTVRGLGETLKESAAGAMLICDGWTPASQRGNEYEALCAGMIANLLHEKGKCAWAFSVDTDSTSALERAGFVARFCLVRKRKLFFMSTTRTVFSENERPAMDLHPAA